MSPLALLAALHALGRAPLAREGGKLLLSEEAPEEAAHALRPFKPALLNALEDGEEVAASRLLSSPYRLAALLAHALGVEGPIVLTLYWDGDPRRYLAPPGNLAPHLAWASRSLPPPRRLHLAPTTGEWTLEVWEGWEVAVEALDSRHLLLLPAFEGHAWGEAARRWRRGEPCHPEDKGTIVIDKVMSM